MTYDIALPGMGQYTVRPDDVVITPPDVAAKIVSHFQPSGVILDPCSGDGVFLDLMPGAEWCEIRRGRDFFQWTKPVDWIVSNPPYSIFSSFLRHSFTVARDIVYLIPINKAFNSYSMMLEIHEWGGVKEIYTVGRGSSLRFPINFTIGAVHFQKGYTGPTYNSFMRQRGNKGD